MTHPESSIAETVVIEGARLELLRCLALVEQSGTKEKARIVAEGGNPDHWPDHVPLFVGEWVNDHDDILLAAKEAWRLGHIEFNDRGRHPNGPMVRITSAGAVWIRDRDIRETAAVEARRGSLKRLK